MSDNQHTSYTSASLLLAHGSSDPLWLEPFNHLLAQIRAQLENSGSRVELAYMELAEPSLASQIRALAAEGIRHIDVLPLFFAAGRHLRKDVPAMLESLKQELLAEGHDLEINLHTPVGLEPEVANAISQVVIRQIR